MTTNGHQVTDTGTYDEQDDYRRELTLDELAATLEKVEKINARAAKRGWTGRLTVEHETAEVTEENEAGIEVTRKVFLVQITGTPPKYEGWTFLAVLDWHSAGGELITRMAPGVDFEGTIDRTNLRPGACDHCGMVRDRKDIYLVRNDEGRTLQVGSTCIKDFLGWSAMPCFISQDDSDAVFEGTGASGRWVDFAVEDVLAIAWALIKRDGFRPASFDNSTKWDVLSVLDPRGERQKKFAQDIRAEVAAARPQAEQIRAYVLSDDFKGDSEYVVNLRVACRANYITARAFGLVVSAPQAWARAIERDLTRKAEKAALCNEHVGAVGDKLELTVTVKAIRPVDNGFGTSYLYMMTDAAGHAIRWFSSSKALGDEVTGELVTIKGTVKKLDEYNGAKQTVLTRCKVV